MNKPVMECTVRELIEYCSTHSCGTCAFEGTNTLCRFICATKGGKESVEDLSIPSKSKPIVFTEIERTIAKAMCGRLAHSASKIEFFVAGPTEPFKNIRVNCGKESTAFVLPFEFFPTMQAHNLDSVTAAEILKEENNA